MSSTNYITTRKHLKSYDLLTLLRKINDKRFGGMLTVNPAGVLSRNTPIRRKWVFPYGNPRVIYQGKCLFPVWDDLEFRAKSARKLAVRQPETAWMVYVDIVFRHELGKMTHGILSNEDEGLGTWKPAPKKYPSFRVWTEQRHEIMRHVLPHRFEEAVDRDMALVPPGMEQY
jgi:hypothetical protein